jgi:hypothetical protein
LRLIQALQTAGYISPLEGGRYLIHGNETQLENLMQKTSAAYKGGAATKARWDAIKAERAQRESARPAAAADSRTASQTDSQTDSRAAIREHAGRIANGGPDASSMQGNAGQVNAMQVNAGHGDAEHPADDSSPPRRPAKSKAPPGPKTAAGQVWESYRSAYVARYGQEPVRNARVNSQCANLVHRVGGEAAVKLVAFYLTHNGRFYVQTCHAFGPCLQDAEALHTQMLGGHRVTSSDAQAQDKRQGTVQAFANVAAKLAAERSDNGNG